MNIFMDNNETNLTEVKTVKNCSINCNLITTVISVIALLIAIACGIFIFINKGKTTNQVSNVKMTDSVANQSNIAYINTDSLLLSYNYSVLLNEDLLTEKAKLQKSMEAKYQAFQVKYNAFMEKARLGSFLSQKSMEDQQEALAKEHQRLQTMEEDLTNKLLEKQAKLNTELLDTVLKFLNEYNADQRYSMILNSAVILYGHEGMNITKEVTDLLNKRYNPDKEKNK